MNRLIGILALSVFIGVGGCSSTSSNVQSAPIQYDQDRADVEDDRPIIRGQFTLLSRQNPGDGAVKAIADVLPNVATSLNPAGALTVFGTSPERVFAELEKGNRQQITSSFAIDQANNKKYDIHTYLTGIRWNPEKKQWEADSGDLIIESYDAKKEKESDIAPAERDNRTPEDREENSEENSEE